MPKDTVARYLGRHAEPLTRELPEGIRPARHVICIPACAHFFHAGCIEEWLTTEVRKI